MLTKGIRSAANGMNAAMQAQDVTASNLANASTNGFKKDVAVFGSFEANLKDANAAVSGVADIVPDTTQGPMVATGNPMDLAIMGKGFFAVETPEGRRYTRAGNFTVSANGEISTPQGYAVAADAGTVTVPAGKSVAIGDNGTVFIDGVASGRLKIVDCGEGQRFIKTAGNFYVLEGEEVQSAAEVKAGFLEQSNVNVVNEMVQMIAQLRGFEAAQKLIRLQDDTLDKAVNSVGKV